MKTSTNIVALLLRIVFGGLMIINHGWRKIMQFVSDKPIQFADPIGLGETTSLVLAAFAEVICCVLIVFGLFTRVATIPPILTMVIAIFFVHLSDPFKEIETALLFLSGYVAIAMIGPGHFSFDSLWQSKRKSRINATQ